MPNQTDIQNTILSASYKNAQAIQSNYNLIQGGKTAAKSDYINYIWLSIDGLQYLYDLGDYTSNTTLTLYNRLNGFIGFDTNVNSLDPNAQIPNSVIVIVNPSGYISPIPYIPWSSFDPATEVDGGRSIYYNTDWAGFNPVLSLTSPAETALTLGVDYQLITTGGISFLDTSPVIPGGLIYDGQAVRASSYVKV